MQRFASPFAQSVERSGAARAFVWALLISRVGDYWLYGVGLGNTPLITAQASQMEAKGLHAHNFYLDCFVDLGILGLLLAVVWHARLVWRALRWRRSHPALLPMVIYFLVEAMFSGLNMNFMTWLVLASGYLLLPAAVGVQKGARAVDAPAPGEVLS
jgi:O-antigen ligase